MITHPNTWTWDLRLGLGLGLGNLGWCGVGVIYPKETYLRQYDFLGKIWPKTINNGSDDQCRISFMSVKALDIIEEYMSKEAKLDKSDRQQERHGLINKTECHI